MATNNNGNLLDSAGEVAIDFVWGNIPMQPNDARPDTNRLDPALDNHIIALSGWNGFPQYAPNTPGEDVAGPTDYILTPNVLGLTTALATDALKDASFATVTVASAATNSAKTIVDLLRASGSTSLRVTTGAAHGYVAGNKVTLTQTWSGPENNSGTYTIVSVPTTTSFTVTTSASSNISATDTDLGSVVAVSGTIKAQSLTAGQNNVVPGSAVTITPWA